MGDNMTIWTQEEFFYKKNNKLLVALVSFSLEKKKERKGLTES
jgi:hypothetical protein